MIAFVNVSIWNYWVNFPPQNSKCQEVAHKPLTRSHNMSQIVVGQTNFLNIEVVLYCISRILHISYLCIGYTICMHQFGWLSERGD